MKKIISILLLAVFFYSCKQTGEPYIVGEHIINEAVYASGEVYPTQYYFLKSPKTAPILRILVKEGDYVLAGDILVIMGSTDETKKIRLAFDQVTIARENANGNSAILNEIQAKIDIAQQQYQQDKAHAESYHTLAATKAVSLQEAESKLLAAERSLAEVNTLKEQYTVTQNRLNNQLLTTELQLADVSRQYNDNAIRSNISGKVYSILKEEGETADSDTPILMVGVDNAFKLELSIDERDISKITTGQKIYFESNTYPGKQFKAFISKIDPVMRKDLRYFKVEALISDSTFFFPQSSAEACIIIRENANAIMIPFGYLNGDNICLPSKTEKVMVPVKTGIRINDLIEIKAGIVAGDIILKPAVQ
ncbi:MAG: HlyD family efflux transporter periplasmic adaptor subunit [Tannerellaceae bacterium]|nr:HlyD family efflux transporter periplasmic adaptor subunit [Tannerellaceae bacterium]